ncbi:hypothetical protein IU479_14505 [Nocardia abscessus]|uniref:hypothetical protein n=1 Tax=Nocardia TaxID=1817 RepID=UPI0018961A2E|nr:MULTISPECIES: hypothetical protein [Nocardia]MBF6219322.1 hypothetical protein [Nocardia abscessus]
MKHAAMRVIAATAIALTAATAAPVTATASNTAEPVASAVDLPPGVVDSVRSAIASVLFFGIVGLCLVRVLPPDQCHFF